MRQPRALAVLGCIAALLSGCGAIGGTGGQVVSYQGYGGTAIVSADGRTITVGQFGAFCPAKVKAVARESASRVALFLQYSTPRNPPSCPQDAAMRIPSQQVRLRAPLGSRKLVDGRTGKATAWISARLVLRPTRLPPGYHLFELIPAVDLSQAQSPGPAGCTQIYRSPNRASELVIVQSAGTLGLSRLARPGWTPVRVRGYPGHANRNIITWREHGLTDHIVVGVQNPLSAPQVLSTKQLIAIADSAPQPR